MTEPEKSTLEVNEKSKRSYRWIVELSVVVGLFLVIGWWQEKDLLPDDRSVAAPAFTLPSLSGEVVAFDPSANKPALIYFFAPWCNICHVSIENTNAVREQYTEEELDIYIVALSWASADDVQEFVDEHQLPAKVLLGTNATMTDFNVQGFPTYYLVDNQGKISGSSVGYSTSLGMLGRAKLND